MLLIGGYLMTDKSNNRVHLRWLPLLRNFTECRALSWGSAVLAWTYKSLSLVAQRGVTDITGCTPLLMSWIYQRFPQWCLPNRGVYQYPLAASREEISMRPGSCVRGFPFTGYISTSSRGESMMTLLCRLCVRHGFVRRRSGGHGCQPSPIVLQYRPFSPRRSGETAVQWRARFEPGRRITVQHTFDTRPTLEYYDWWRGAFRVRHLSGQQVLEDPRLAELPADVQPTASQPRDNLALPCGMPDRRRCVTEGRDDIRRPARRERDHRERQPDEPVRRDRARPRQVGVGIESDEEAEYAHQEEHGNIPVDKEPSPPSPPPHPSHGAWHSSGSGGAQPLGDWDIPPPGWHEGGPSGTHQEEDDMLDEILLGDAFDLHTVAPPQMDRLAAHFRTVREVGIGDYQHASGAA
ncbi:uncharacterized protein DS421_11g321430 [Arachis hypogaea]|nr:uncharacterized protein DS421_11g321430 [Arachis hypogaea]